MESNKILLAFKDAQETKAFSGYLSSMGFELLTAADGARTLEIALQETPSLIITEPELPVIGGERVFQILRHNPHTSSIPFLFISKAIADIKGFKAGRDIFLLRPVNQEEFYARIRQTLSANGAASASKEIEGRLSHMSLADILQFLHLNKKEGELKIITGDATGSVFIKDGQIYNAALDGIEKEKALFRMLQWTDGKFEFAPKAVSVSKKIRTTTGNLLMEGMRQIDEFRKKEDQFPGRKAVLKAKIETSMLPKELQPVIYEVMNLVKAYPRVGDIIDHCTYPDYEAYSAIANLLGKGVLEEEKSGGDNLKPEEFLTPDQAISIREKIMSRFTDMQNFSYGKIFIISTSGQLSADFISKCRSIPGFSMDQRSALSQIALENPLGTVASLKLYGGMDLLLYSIPTVRNMGPLWKAFSTNMVGLILLWDDEGATGIKDLSDAKREILLRRRVPVVHVYSGESTSAEYIPIYKKAFNLRPDEPLLRLDAKEGGMIFEVFYSLFGNLLKADYVA